MLKKLYGISILLLVSIASGAQSDVNVIRINSSYTSFPDTGRNKGHTYKTVLYDATRHYMDSSVLIITPKKLEARKKLDMIFWFHGWGNNIDSAVVRYDLTKQFVASKVNAVLVLAETAKDAPDSYGGKLEQKSVFNSLLHDVLYKLKTENMISKRCKKGNIILAGHSGAYRVMAYILQNGNVPVKEVILFDALYAETDKFISWIQTDLNNRFINVYTNNGGTYDESKEMIKQLFKLKIRADTVEEKDLTPEVLQREKIVFIHSLHEHNDIIRDPDNFQFFIENTSWLKGRR